MTNTFQTVREDIRRIKHDTKVEKTVAHVKTNIDPETKPSSRASPRPPPPHAALTFSHSHSFFSLILSFCTYWAAKLSLSFTAYPGQEGNNASTLCSPEYVLETQSGPLIRHILFSFFFHSPVREKGRGGGARSKGKRLSVLPFLFFPPSLLFFLLCFCVHALTCTSFSCVSILILPMVTFFNE